MRFLLPSISTTTWTLLQPGACLATGHIINWIVMPKITLVFSPRLWIVYNAYWQPAFSFFVFFFWFLPNVLRQMLFSAEQSFLYSVHNFSQLLSEGDSRCGQKVCCLPRILLMPVRQLTNVCGKFILLSSNIFSESFSLWTWPPISHSFTIKHCMKHVDSFRSSKTKPNDKETMCVFAIGEQVINSFSLLDGMTHLIWNNHNRLTHGHPLWKNVVALWMQAWRQEVLVANRWFVNSVSSLLCFTTFSPNGTARIPFVRVN